MAAIDSILGTLALRRATRLVLKPGEKPLLHAGSGPGEPLQMMKLPPETVADLLAELFDDDGRARLARGEPVATTHRRGDERYSVRARRDGTGVTGELELLQAVEGGTFPSPLAEAKLRRASPGGATEAAETSPRPSPSPAPIGARPNLPAPSSPADPARAIAPVERAPSPPSPSVQAASVSSLPPVAEPAGDGIAREIAPLLASALAPAFALMAARGASDLHLAPASSPRLRIDGALRPLDEPVLADQAAASLDHVLGQALARSGGGRGGLDLAVSLAGAGRFRIHVFRQIAGLSLAIRRLPESVPDLATLGLPRDLEALVALPNGLVLVVGPTGSGKSTTLAALAARALARRALHVVTLEDPIEYLLPPGLGLVQQRAVGEHVASFAAGLVAALREDPDLLVVGELRDAETIDLALRAAETGHLVLATLHSGSTAGAIRRLVDAFPADRRSGVRAQIADVLRAVVAQRLIPRSGGGRVLALELLRTTYAAQSLIREDKAHQLVQLLETGQESGSFPLERSLIALERAGTIRPESAEAVAQNPDLLRALRLRK